MKSFKQYISEASFKIDMPDMPSVYVDAQSAGEVKKKLRGLLKKPMDVEVSRVNPAKVKKAFRLRAQGKDEDEEVKEALDKQDEPKVKEIIKKLKGASKAHAGQAKDLEKAVSEKKMYNINFGVIGDVSVKASSQTAAIKHAKKQMLKKNPKFKKDLEKFKVTVIKDSAVSEKRGRPRKDGTSDGDLENIQMQLRKSVSLRGKKDVEFADGKKKKVDDKVARKVLQMIDKYRKPQDKQNIVNYIAKSEKNLMSFASGKAKDSEMDPEAKRKKLLGIK